MRDIKDIPIVFTNVTDPIEQGIVSGLTHPGGNVTGFTNPPFTLDGKSLQMLKEVAPRVTDIALVISADRRGLRTLQGFRYHRADAKN